MRTMTYNFELQKDRTVTFKLPNDIPLGFHKIVLVVDEKPITRSQQEFNKLLKQTSGIWQQGDGLQYQTKLRDEWERS